MPDRKAPADRSTHDSMARIEDEHRQLRELLTRMDAIDGPGPLAPLLDELHTLLEEHFAEEEAPQGLHKAVEEMAPHKLPRVGELFDEHRVMLDELAELRTQTRRCIEGPLAEILRRKTQLSTRLREHEARETDLFDDALYTDLGGES